MKNECIVLVTGASSDRKFVGWGGDLCSEYPDARKYPGYKKALAVEREYNANSSGGDKAEAVYVDDYQSGRIG